MKKVFSLSLILLSLTIVGIISCKKNESSTTNTTPNVVKSTRTAINNVRTFGTEFSSLGLAGFAYEQGLNHLGQVHNDYQQTLLTQLYDEHINSVVGNDFITNVKLKSISFFNSKQVSIPSGCYQPNFGTSLTEMNIVSSNYSSEGYQLLIELKAIMSSPEVENNQNLFADLESLKQRALNLQSETEVITVGTPIVIAIYSYNYWKANSSTWMTKFNYLKDNNVSNKMKIGWGQLGWADVGGAINGGMKGGCGGGPAGAAAGAILGASGASLFNLFGQIATKDISWW